MSETTPSFFRATGLRINVYRPGIDLGVPSYVPAGHPIAGPPLAEMVVNYMQTISAFGGYDSASITLAGDRVNIEDWLGWLGYHLVVCDPDLDEVWAGFINSITAMEGGLSVVRGPLIDVGNRAEIVYSTVDA